MRYFMMMCLVALLPWSAAALEREPAAGTAALVNGSLVTTADFRAELDRVLRQRGKSEQELGATPLAILKKEVLETLIGRELLFQESVARGIRVEDSAVEAEVTRLASQVGSREELRASLARLNLSEELITAQIRRGMAIQTLLDGEFGSRITVTEAEAKNYYDGHQESYRQPGEVTQGKTAAVLPFEALRDVIIKQLRGERATQEVTLLLKRLRTTARVEIHLVESD